MSLRLPVSPTPRIPPRSAGTSTTRWVQRGRTRTRVRVTRAVPCSSPTRWQVLPPSGPARPACRRTTPSTRMSTITGSGFGTRQELICTPQAAATSRKRATMAPRFWGPLACSTPAIPPRATPSPCLPTRASLRITLNGTWTGDADLYVKAGSPPTPSDYTCRGTRVDSFEYCGLPSPSSGTWYVMVLGASGLPLYQLTATNLRRCLHGRRP